MSAQLVFHWRLGLLSTVAAGKIPHVQVGGEGPIDEGIPVGPVRHRLGIETPASEKLESMVLNHCAGISV